MGATQFKGVLRVGTTADLYHCDGRCTMRSTDFPMLLPSAIAASEISYCIVPPLTNNRPRLTTNPRSGRKIFVFFRIALLGVRV
jgi:hypothetical protein